MRKTTGAKLSHYPICFDAVADYPPVLALVFQSTNGSSKGGYAYRLFHSNPAHPGLHFKKLEGEDNIYSARIGLDFRALAVMKGDRIVWYWIGSHADYDLLV